MSVKLTRIQENRLWNLRQLIKAAGGTNAAAEKLARSPSYLTGIAGPQPQRTIGDRIATHIETAVRPPVALIQTQANWPVFTPADFLLNSACFPFSNHLQLH